MTYDDILGRLRRSDPYPMSADLGDGASTAELRDAVRTRIEAGSRPDARPQRRGPAIAAATAVAVLVVGVGVLLFANRDDSGVPPATAPTTTGVTVTTAPDTTVTTTPNTTTTPGSALPSCSEAEPERAPAASLSFFAVCGSGNGPAYPVYRNSPSVLLQDRLAEMVEGTSGREQARGLSTGFDSVPVEERVGVNVTVAQSGDGVVTLDFLIGDERWNPGRLAGTSAQLFSFLDPLEATVFADPTVTGLDRSTLCWGESDCSGVTTRAEWEGRSFVNHGVLFTAGCDLEAFFIADGCTVDLNASTYAATVVNVAADDTLNVRSGPGAEYFAVAELPPSSEVAAFDRVTAIAADGGLWRLVRLFDDGATVGWVNTAFIALSDIFGPRPGAYLLIDSFVLFANNPTGARFSALPLGEVVELGLGESIESATAAASLRSPDEWTIDVEDFGGYVGPFSAFELLARLGNFEVTVGPHDHCAGPPRPAPAGFENLTRISVQPVLGPQSSCLEWFTVDFFTTTEGLVEGITLDLWEP